MRAMIAAILLALSSTAAAERWSGGISLGNAELDESCPVGVSCDFTNTGMRLFLGQDVSPNARIEGYYTNLGSMDVSFVDIDTHVFGLAYMPKMAVGSFDIYGRLALALWETEVSAPFLGSDTDNGTDIAWGFGGRYRIDPMMAIRGEYEQYSVDPFGGDLDYDMVSVGIELYF